MIPYVYVAAIVVSLGGFNFGYATGVVGGILANPHFQKRYGIHSDNEAQLLGNIASCLQFGGLLGVAVQAKMNDVLGRKRTIQACMLMAMLGAAFQVFADSLDNLYLGRAITGISLSISTVSVALYNSEISLPENRGKVVGIQQLLTAAGMAVGFWINYCVSTMQWGSAWDYQLPLAGQFATALVLFGAIAPFPQSPRWLALKKRPSQVLDALCRLRELDREDPELAEELQGIYQDIKDSPTSTWEQVACPKHRVRLKLALLFIFFQQFAGQNLIFYYSPLLFRALGLGPYVLLATGMIGLVKLLLTLPALLVIDRLGRRPLMLMGTAIMLCCFLYIGTYTVLRRSDERDHGLVSFYGWLAISLVYVFVAGYSVSWGVVRYVLPSEIFPTAVRAKANTLCSMVDWLFQAVGIKFFPYLVSLLDGYIYFFFSGLLVLFLWWLWYLPETSGMPLEQMDYVFNPEYSPLPPARLDADDIDDLELD
ncbi:hypothetical protein HDU91_001198 [Kappamyces sp. JEL0680]|nr:hypothetical protein HDU91_001198 [Kappamyces sp. JEL0680]